MRNALALSPAVARLAAAAAPWTPAALAPYAWYRADSLVASPVSTWPDRSGNGRDLTGAGANRPTWSATSASFNNQPVVTSTATQRVQAATPSAWRFLHNGAAGSVLGVGRTTDNATAQWFAGTQGSSGANVGASLILLGGGQIRLSVGNGTSQFIAATSAAGAFPTTAGHSFAYTYRSGTNPDGVLYVAGASVATASETAAPAAGDPTGAFYSSGVGSGAAFGLIGDIAELVVLDREATPTELATFTAYALARYGV